MRRSLFALVVRDDDARVVVYLSTLRRSNPIILVHFSPPKCILWYVSFRFYSVFFFLNAEQRERNNHRFLITSAFKLLLLFKLLRVESLFCSRSLMKPIRIPREESNPLEKSFRILSLLNSLSYSVRKSALFPVLLLSFASFESAREELQLSGAFIVVSIRRSISSTTTEEHQHHHQLGERKRVNFCLVFCFLFFGFFFFSRAKNSFSLSVCCFHVSAFSLFRFSFRSLFRSLSSHFFCS